MPAPAQTARCQLGPHSANSVHVAVIPCPEQVFSNAHRYARTCWAASSFGSATSIVDLMNPTARARVSAKPQRSLSSKWSQMPHLGLKLLPTTGVPSRPQQQPHLPTLSGSNILSCSLTTPAQPLLSAIDRGCKQDKSCRGTSEPKPNETGWLLSSRAKPFRPTAYNCKQ